MEIANVPRLEGWLTLTEVAEKLGISRQATHQRAAGEKFRMLRRVGRVYVVHEAEVDAEKACPGPRAALLRLRPSSAVCPGSRRRQRWRPTSSSRTTSPPRS